MSEIKQPEANVFQQLVQLERERQNKKFPSEDQQNNVSLDRWGNILAEEFGEFCKEIVDGNELKAIIELAETAAVCQRIAEVRLGHVIDEAYLIMLKRTREQKPAY